MDWIATICNFFLWWPWLNIWSDLWFLQLCMLYLLYLIIFSNNMYYTLLYLFIELFYFGIFLSFIQMELFTGFLWVLEATVVFIALLMLFYLNIQGFLVKINLLVYKFYFVGFFLFFFLIIFDFPSEFEFYIPNQLNFFDLWDDFYEALNNTNMNDFMGLLLGYYYLNSFEFLIVGLLLLLGSIACVNLFKINRLTKLQKYDNFFKIFDFFKDFCDYIFLRKQNLMNQSNSPVASRIFKRKK